MNTDQTHEKNLGEKGTEHSVKGKLNQAAGTVQKKVGQVTGDKTTEAKGKAREVGGKVQSKVGETEQNVDKTLKSIG